MFQIISTYIVILMELYKGISCDSQVALPLLNDMKAPLMAHLDVSELNQVITGYINTEVERKIKQSINTELNRLVKAKTDVLTKLVQDKTDVLTKFVEDKVNAGKNEIKGTVNETITSALQANQVSKQSRCLVNLAAGKTSSQSSSHGHFSAGRATNGNLNDFTHTRYPNGESKPWLRIDLGKHYKIYEIEIFNRKDCCGYKLHDFDVRIGKSLHNMELCGHYEGQASNGERIIMMCKTHPVARHVQIQIVKGHTNILHVAEVLVWGTD